MQIRVKKLHASATIPKIALQSDAGFDLYSAEAVVVNSGERVQAKTGIAMEIPEGYVGLIWDKSGLSQKHGLKTLGGVIDAGYRGEVIVGVTNLSEETYTVEVGHKIAQMLIQKVEAPEFIEVGELSQSNRGEKGFGSTGK
jgi:dUTP pyrophosphatase